MASFTDYITVEGERMLAKAVAGTSVSFTKIVIGSGYMPSGAYEKNIKEVITPEVELPVQSVSVNSSDSVLITARFTNKDIEHGFFLREKAVYMSDGNDEVLAIYGNNGSSAEFIDTAEVCVVDKTIKSVVKLSTQELANINIVDDTYEFAPLIEPDIKAINDFVKTTAALAMRVGQRVILNKWTAYTYIGYDPTDASCYITGANVLSDVYDEKLADGSAERGVGASQNALFNVYGIASGAVEGLSFHLQDKENPHEVTKEQVGLGNVPNVETNDQTPTYEESEELKTLKSGEKLSISFGKIMKAITELIGLKKNVSELNSNLANKVNTTDSRLSDARTPKAHTHDDRYYTETEIDNKFLKFGDAISMFSAQIITAPSDGFIFIFANPKTKDTCSIMVTGGSFGNIRVSISNGVSESTVGMVRKGDTLSISYTSGAFEGNSQCLYVPIH